MKVSIGIVVAIVVQAFGIIWYVAQLDSTVSNLDSTVSVMQQLDSWEVFDPSDLEEAIEELDEAINLLDKRSGIVENEMRTIMSDHSGFNDALKDLGLSGYSDNRTYGSYGK